MLLSLLAQAAIASASTLLATAPVSSPFAGTWSGSFTVGGGNGGVTTITIAGNGHVTGTYTNLTFGISGTILGEVRNNGSFRLNGFRDDLPQGVDITCGEFEIAGNHLVTSSWGVAESGCNNAGWSQDLERQ